MLQIITIQCYWRRWLAQRRVRKLVEEKNERERMEHELHDSLIKEKENLLREEYLRRTNPKTKSDFDLVYKTIESTE